MKKTNDSTKVTALNVPFQQEVNLSDKDQELHSGDICPQCGKGRLDYDGLLNLSCVECGYTVGGCFT